MADAKRIILDRRARFIAAALAGCTPAARPVDSAGQITIPPLADAEIRVASADSAPPPPPPPVEDAGVRVIVSACLSIYMPPKITFSSNSAKVARSQTLEQVASTMLANPQIDVEIEGHTDPSEQLMVGQQRADAVLAELVRRGVSQSRLTTSNAGASKPIVPNINDVNRAKNRRVEFIVR